MKARTPYNKRRLVLLIQALKLAIGCENCGYKAKLKFLDFHHRDSKTRLYIISEAVFKLSIPLLFKEIDKCDILCKSCHAKVDGFGRRRGKTRAKPNKFKN